MNVSACLVTRGDVDMLPIIEPIWAAGITDVVVWDNSVELDLGVYGRYAAIERAEHPLIYVQDDDCVVDPATIAALLAAYEPGGIAANMPTRFLPHYPESCLVGFGAIFYRDDPERAFTRFEARYLGQRMKRPDVIFTTLTPRTIITGPVEILPYAENADRQWKQRHHWRERQAVLRRARFVRDH